MSLKLFLITGISFKIDNIILDPDPNWAIILDPDPNIFGSTTLAETNNYKTELVARLVSQGDRSFSLLY